MIVILEYEIVLVYYKKHWKCGRSTRICFCAFIHMQPMNQSAYHMAWIHRMSCFRVIHLSSTLIIIIMCSIIDSSPLHTVVGIFACAKIAKLGAERYCGMCRLVQTNSQETCKMEKYCQSTPRYVKQIS